MEMKSFFSGTTPNTKGSLRRRRPRPRLTLFVMVSTLGTILLVGSVSLKRQLSIQKLNETTLFEELFSESNVWTRLESKAESSYDECRDLYTETIILQNECPAITKQNSLGTQIDQITSLLAPYRDEIIEEATVSKNRTAVILPNAICGSNQHNTKSSDITVVSQMDVTKVKRLSVLAQRWGGPLSVAVRLTSLEDIQKFHINLNDYMHRLDMVSFHLYIENIENDYPQNLLRNVALDNIRSDYFFLLDIDLLPSPIHTHQQLRNLFDDNIDLEQKLINKSVFVFPAFATLKNIPESNITIQHPFYPETKEIATKMKRKGPDKAIQVFWAHFPQGQRSTDYAKWNDNQTDHTYSIKPLEWGYEPYVLGSTENLPRLYPNFRGFGYDKVSFITELYYAGYSFEVLRDFFIFHIHHPTSYGRKNKKRTEKINSLCIEGFINHILNKYGAGSREVDHEMPGWNIWREKYDMAISSHPKSIKHL